LAFKRTTSGHTHARVIQRHAKELEGYVTKKSAAHLPLYREVPVSLVKKLVRARMEVNEAEARPSRR
jgi:hypothetical protein